MPIYEYACRECGHEFEKLVKMNAEPPPCPECGSDVKKKVSAAGFILKGGGWYKDHYGLKPSKSESKSGDGGSSKGDSGGSGGSGDSGGSTSKGSGSDTPSKPKAASKPAGSSSGGGDS